MAISNTRIILKKSGVSGNVPSSLALGETALNYADGILYYYNGTSIKSLSSKSFSTINVNSTLVLAASATDVLSFTSSNGITVTANATSKTVNIDGNSVYQLANNAYSSASYALDWIQQSYFKLAYFPTGDYGFLGDTIYGGLANEEVEVIYDMRLEPIVGGFLDLDAGYVN